MSCTKISIDFWLPTQAILLILHYGLKWDMPWWVTWFPSLLIIAVLGIAALVLLVIVIGAVVVGTYDAFKTWYAHRKWKKVHKDWVKENNIKGR